MPKSASTGASPISHHTRRFPGDHQREQRDAQDQRQRDHRPLEPPRHHDQPNPHL
jgi:hypothetical protein